MSNYGIILANKFFAHEKSGFQFIDYSNNSILLRNKKKDVSIFLPKVSITIHKLENGNLQIDVPRWLILRNNIEEFC